MFEIDMMEYCGHYENLLKPNEKTTFFRPEQRGYFTHLAQGLASSGKASSKVDVWESWLLGKTSVYHCMGLSPDMAYQMIDDAITGKTGGYDLVGVLAEGGKAVIKITKSDPPVFPFNLKHGNIDEANLAIFSQIFYDNGRTQVLSLGWSPMVHVKRLWEATDKEEMKRLWFLALHRESVLFKVCDLKKEKGL